MNLVELAKEACHSMKLMRGRFFPSLPGRVFLRWVNWTREQFLGVPVTMEMTAFAAIQASVLWSYIYGCHIFTFFQNMRIYKISSMAFSQSRDTSSSLLHLTLGLGKQNGKAFIWLNPVCFIDSLKVIPIAVIPGRGVLINNEIGVKEAQTSSFPDRFLEQHCSIEV